MATVGSLSPRLSMIIRVCAFTFAPKLYSLSAGCQGHFGTGHKVRSETERSSVRRRDRGIAQASSGFCLLASLSHVVYGVVTIRYMILSPFQRAYRQSGLSRRRKDVETPFEILTDSDHAVNGVAICRETRGGKWQSVASEQSPSQPRWSIFSL